MYTKTYSATLKGIEANIIGVEIDASKGIPGFNIVGLADKSINEAKERISVAMRAVDFEIHPKRILVNLSPAQNRKEGAQLDLAIAAALMVNFAYIDVEPKFLEEFCLLGELSLTGDLKAITGTLSFLLEAADSKLKYLIIPKANEKEASLVTLKQNFQSQIFTVSDLHELKSLIEALAEKNKGIDPANAERLKLIETCIENYKIKTLEFSSLIKEVTSKRKNVLDLDDVIGQAHAKRALEIAATGKHHLLMIGPPGCGKSMLAKRFISLIPDLGFDAALDSTKIYSISNNLKEEIILRAPLRSPHHSASSVSLTGGGVPIKPGEVSLAHNGVLFLDELTEFNRFTIEQLRQILEEKSVIISRAKQSVEYPADFILVAACNPCPCGYLGDEKKSCTCSQLQISKYVAKLSGPFLDRIDLHIELTRLAAEEISKLTDKENLKKPSKGLDSNPVKERVLAGRDFLKKEQANFNVTKEAKEFIDHVVFNTNLSARSHQKILKVSKTIAALEKNLEIEVKHLAEAMQYRSVSWEKYRK